MLQSVSDSYGSSLSPLSRTESAAQTAKAETDTDAGSGSSADSIEIRDQARAAAEQYVAVSVSGAQASSQTSGGTAQSSGSPAKSSGSAALEKALESESKTVSSSASSETEDSTNLSVLTESQLDKLVSEGKITKTQETGELRRRAAEKARQQSPSEQAGLAAGYNAQAGPVSDGSAAVGSALDTVA